MLLSKQASPTSLVVLKKLKKNVMNMELVMLLLN